MMANNSPTANDIQTLLTTLGYHIRRPPVSSTLFFAETTPPSSQQPILLNIYYTTRSIMTYLNHPTSGQRELWRSNAYESLDELASIVRNPRMHTGKGYRNKNKAMRGCVGCGMMKERVEFSGNQWRKGPDENRCLICMEEEQSLRCDEGDDEVLIRNLQNLKLRKNNIKKEETQDSDIFSTMTPTLTTDMLRQHDRTLNTTNTTNNAHEIIESRQFSCPICPEHNRGPHIFYKKVPSHKPIIKCPKCKAANKNNRPGSNDNLRRLYPIPKGEEKGYGLYKCHKCRDFWGSSRAVGNVGQNCFKCAGMGRETYVKPFRMEVHKRGGKKKGGNNGRKKMVPKEPIGEEEVDERFYGDNDRMRNEAPGNNSYGGGGGGEGDDSDYNDQTYDFVDSDRSSSSSVASSSSIVRPNRIPRGYQHKCSACATGACRNRKVPKSEVRDEMDGNTVSTRASIVTDSSMDKTDFVDRDEDFSGFEEDSESGGGDDGAWKQEQKINEEDSNEAIIAIGETFTCEQLVQQKFDHAAANGYIIEI